jgi:hypothetical protein
VAFFKASGVALAGRAREASKVKNFILFLLP